MFASCISWVVVKECVVSRSQKEIVFAQWAKITKKFKFYKNRFYRNFFKNICFLPKAKFILILSFLWQFFYCTFFPFLDAIAFLLRLGGFFFCVRILTFLQFFYHFTPNLKLTYFFNISNQKKGFVQYSGWTFLHQTLYSYVQNLYTLYSYVQNIYRKE